MEDLIESAPCGFFSFSDEGTIGRANATLSNLLGYEPGELTGLPVDRILPVAGRIFYQTHLFPLLRMKGNVEEIYITLRTKDGSSLPTLLNAVRRERMGQILNDCVLLQMKERSEYEDAILKARNEAESAIRTKDQFLAAVSHELRTPLHSMKGWVHMLRHEQHDDQLLEKGLGSIERGVNSLKSLIEDLIDFSRMNSGKLRLSVDRLEVADLVDAALDIVRPAAEAKAIALERQIEAASAPVSGDAERLQQVLWNMLSNAIKFTPKGGTVKVTLSRVNSSVEIVVADNGKGIAADFLPFVFERFRQGEQEAGGRGGGLGLGMTITKHIVELHGGVISAESPGEGSGATFRVRLPIMTLQRSDPFRPSSMLPYNGAPQPGELGGLEGLWVLVVEDDPHARTMLTTVLEHAGAQVISAANIKGGLEEFRVYRPHLIVSDIELSDGDGYSLIGSVREAETDGEHVPAIALTALARATDRFKALAAGFSMHIAKPVEPVELILAISSLTTAIRMNGNGTR